MEEISSIHIAAPAAIIVTTPTKTTEKKCEVSRLKRLLL